MHLIRAILEGIQRVPITQFSFIFGPVEKDIKLVDRNATMDWTDEQGYGPFRVVKEDV